jgi:hypothetical protein
MFIQFIQLSITQNKLLADAFLTNIFGSKLFYIQLQFIFYCKGGYLPSVDKKKFSFLCSCVVA